MGDTVPTWMHWAQQKLNAKPAMSSFILLDHQRGSIPLTVDRFHSLPIASLPPVCGVVDGGMSILWTSATQVVGRLRIYGGIWRGHQQEHCNLQEHTLNITFHDHQWYIETQNPTSLPPSISSPSAEQTFALCREFLEWSMAQELVRQLPEQALLVMDGSLLPEHPIIRSQQGQLMIDAEHRSLTVVGLSKTTSLVTERGTAAPEALFALAPSDQRWYFTGEGSPITTHFCLLHKASQEIFRIDCSKTANTATFLPSLASLATDAFYPGYPYPLLRAHLLARIRESDTERYRKLFESCTPRRQGMTGHDILDTL